MWERILRLRCKPNQLWGKCREDFLPVTAVKRNSSRLWRVSFLGIKINSHIFRLKGVQFRLICWQSLWYRLMFTAQILVFYFGLPFDLIFFGVPFMFVSFVCFQRWEGLLSASYSFVLISADQIGYFLLSHQCFIRALKFTLSTYKEDKLVPFPQKHHVCWRKSPLIQSQISIWTPLWLILSIYIIIF